MSNQIVVDRLNGLIGWSDSFNVEVVLENHLVEKGIKTIRITGSDEEPAIVVVNLGFDNMTLLE